MAETKAIEPPMMGWVKGGTISSAYEKQLQKEDYESEQRRKIQDAQIASTKTGQLPTQLQTPELHGNAPGIGKLSSLRLGGSKSHASVVLALKHPKDTTILDWIICELMPQETPDGGQELVLNICCPRCIYTRNRHPQRAQLKIHQRNRMFHLDTRRQGEIWANPNDPNEIVTLAGTITTEEWITCPHEGCGWQFKIDDSVIYSR